MFLKVPFKQLVVSVGFVAASLTLTGCAGLGGSQGPEVQTFMEGKSFAYNVAGLSHINTPNRSGKHKGRHIEDVEIENLGEIDLSKMDGSADLAGVGLGLGMLNFPSSIGSSGMNTFMALDLILGSAGGHPTLMKNRPVTTAWFPASEATSPKDAMDKFHAMRVEALEKSIRERGIRYDISKNKLNYKLLPWNKPLHRTIITISEEVDGLCSLERPCTLSVKTALPEPKTVIAPKELSGKPFEAYFFSGRLAGTGVHWEDYSDFFARSSSSYEKSYYTGQWREFENFTWLNRHMPEWAVAYMPALRPRFLARVKEGEIITPNPFPYMVHKGEVKLFAVEKNN